MFASSALCSIQIFLGVGVNEDVSFTLYNIQITGRITQKQAAPYHILHF